MSKRISPEFTIKDVLFLEVRYDSEPSRFLVMVQYMRQNKEEFWSSILNNYSDTSIPLRDRVLLSYEDIYPTVLSYCMVAMDMNSIGRNLYNPKIDLIEKDIETSVYEDFSNHYEMTAFIMKGLSFSHIMDEYLYVIGAIRLNYLYEKLSDTMTIASSDALDYFLEHARKEVLVEGMWFEKTIGGYSEPDEGRFLIRQDEYYVLRLDSGYLLSEKNKKGSALHTRHFTRAMKFISEDEALDYAMRDRESALEEFEVERVEEPALLARSKASHVRSIEDMAGLSIRMTHPFLSLESDIQIHKIRRRAL